MVVRWQIIETGNILKGFTSYVSIN
jgi:hypothetical protein